MKKVRIMSNLIADELKTALDESGIQMDEDVFEGQVSDIVEMISESVKNVCEGEDCENCDEEEDEEAVEEGTFYFSNAACTLGGVDVAEGEYVEVEETEDGTFVSIYNEDGDLLDEFIPVSDEDLEAFLANAEELEEDEEEVEEEAESTEAVEEEAEVDEAPVKKFKVKNGKKVKLTKNQIARNKLKARGRLKKGYKFINGKQVKMTAAEKAARRKAGKRLAKKGKAKRARSLKKARQLAAGSDSGTCVVKEGFDLSVNGMKIALEEGDVLDFNNGMITVIREGKVLFSDVQVSESFLDRCFEEAVLEKKCNEEDAEEEEKKEEDAEKEESDVETEAGEEEDTDDDDDKDEDDKDVEECGVKEGTMLTFKSNKGFVLVSEGTELPMGNRIRARATLMSKGFNVTSEQLDGAAAGQVVVL